jgi:CubicO group peptidase (beta-lactamase class C family)
LDVNRAGWNEDALVDTATYAGAHNTAALLITQGGRIVLEQYWAGFGRHSSGDVASAQKSVTSILVGIAQARGLLKLDDAVSKHVGAGWTRAPAPAEQKITVRHLVTMTSGLNDRFEFEAEAGTLWYYNTPAYHMTKRVIERASGQTIEQFTDANLGRPIGWQDTSWKPRANMPMPDGSPMSGLYMSPRDCARFGLMVLAESSWSGKDVLTDKLYLHDALNSSTRLNPSYGYLWWLNGKASNVLPGKPTLREGPLVPAAPPDLVAAMGALDQRIYVVPSKRLVVVRQGRAASGDLGEALTSFDGEFWKRLSAALPR